MRISTLLVLAAGLALPALADEAAPPAKNDYSIASNWLCLPGHDGCSPAATRIHDDYLLEHSCGDAPAVLITGTYLVCRRRYVMFSWRVDGDLCVPESSVEIRLQGDFERTTLSLEHSGFVSSEAWLWHKALWNASMTRLMRLYDAPDSLDSASL